MATYNLYVVICIQVHNWTLMRSSKEHQREHRTDRLLRTFLVWPGNFVSLHISWRCLLAVQCVCVCVCVSGERGGRGGMRYNSKWEDIINDKYSDQNISRHNIFCIAAVKVEHVQKCNLDTQRILAFALPVTERFTH